MQKDSPFQPFIIRMNNDLTNWLARQKQTKQILIDYKNTLGYLNDDFAANSKIMVNHGQNIYSKAKTIDDKVVIRVKEGLFVQMNQKQAIQTVKELIQLYKQKCLVCQTQVSKIMTSMRQIQMLIQQYSSLSSS